MKAVRVVEGTARVTEVAEPAGDGVVVAIRSAGICGSDLHMIEKGYPLGGTLGHEMAGVLADGTAVAVEPLAACGECEACRRGDKQLCRRGPAMILGIGRDGGMAERVLVPPEALVRLPVGVPLPDASLVEPLAVAVHGFRRGGVKLGQRVAVVGGGTIGLCAVAVARAFGARVALVARHDHQRAAGERLGATEASGTYAVVVDAAGTASALKRAVELATPGGKLVLLASYWNGLALPGIPLCLKEIDVHPASLYGRAGDSRDLDVAARILAENAEVARSLITHRLPLDAAPEAFRIAADRSAGAIKVVLEP
jgi:2-desacetyl-2-hydroxyethyl bacteriochlorophyllide A dehydrogenase